MASDATSGADALLALAAFLLPNRVARLAARGKLGLVLLILALDGRDASGHQDAEVQSAGWGDSAVTGWATGSGGGKVSCGVAVADGCTGADAAGAITTVSTSKVGCRPPQRRASHSALFGKDRFELRGALGAATTLAAVIHGADLNRHHRWGFFFCPEPAGRGRAGPGQSPRGVCWP